MPRYCRRHQAAHSLPANVAACAVAILLPLTGWAFCLAYLGV